MSRLHEHEPPSTAQALELWARQRSGSALLARALGLAADAEAAGHACALLDPVEFDLPTLRLHPWVGDGSTLRPAVLNADGALFLWRNFTHEARIAEQLLDRAQRSAVLEDNAYAAEIEQLFAGVDAHKAQLQRSAVAAVIGQRIFVLSGGPGTGKTTTVLRMLLLLQHIAIRSGAPHAIALTAPTGKAAQRLSQSMRDGAAELRSALGAQHLDWEAAFASLPESAQTLHRLLGSQPGEDRFAHHAQHPLPYQLLVIDEASMVDLGLMRAVLDALPPSAVLILLGDPDQLVSVSAGSVLADIVAAAQQEPLVRQHVRLEHVWRTEGRLAEVYAAVRAGNDELLLQLNAADIGLQMHDISDARALQQQLRRWLERDEWAQLDRVLAAPDPPPERAFTALRQLQLISALRGGPFGATQINQWIDLRRRRLHGDARWYPGRPVLVRHNDYNRRLFNGDVGLTVYREGQLSVCFETTDAAGHIGHRYVSPRELPEHDLGYALTIHQSQGSEYAHVAVLLPAEADHRILSRQLLYTGVSRAKRSIEIWSSPASLRSALDTVSLRHGGLRQRLTAASIGEEKAL